MNIYGKLASARKHFHSLNLKKSGKNTFAGYNYFELADFLVPGMQSLEQAGLVSVISFTAAEATMTIYETEGDGTITITSPMASANLKGSHEIQNLGAVETYQRRYLWMAALEIVEHDAVDSAPPKEETVDISGALSSIYNAQSMDSLQKIFASAYKLYGDTASRKALTSAKDRRKNELAEVA
jgi:hypothetical protein